MVVSIASQSLRDTATWANCKVIDAHGNAAALSASNGEGAGYVLPGTGIMMNNMLGEDDINPQGFHRWREGMRMASMMAPTLALWEAQGREAVLGSGGSKRIRSAIPQVLVNLIDFGMDAAAAVAGPRLHADGETLDLEPGFDAEAVRALRSAFRQVTEWPAPSLYFGGVHCVDFDARADHLSGAGDARRGGVFLRAGETKEV